MTILAETINYLVEYDQVGGHRLLTITDKWNGFAKTLSGPKIAGDFRECLKTHSPERVIEVWLKIARNAPWGPIYKPLALTGFRDYGKH